MAHNRSFEPHADQTVVAHGIKIKGNLEAESDIWFDGSIDGNIHSDGNVTISENAVVMGNVIGINIMVNGKIRGHINGKNKVLLQTGCHVEGDIKTDSLGVAEGAKLIGNVNTHTGASIKNSGS